MSLTTRGVAAASVTIALGLGAAIYAAGIYSPAREAGPGGHYISAQARAYEAAQCDDPRAVTVIPATDSQGTGSMGVDAQGNVTHLSGGGGGNPWGEWTQTLDCSDGRTVQIAGQHDEFIGALCEDFATGFGHVGLICVRWDGELVRPEVTDCGPTSEEATLYRVAHRTYDNGYWHEFDLVVYGTSDRAVLVPTYETTINEDPTVIRVHNEAALAGLLDCDVVTAGQ